MDRKGSVIGILVSHVDDILVAGTPYFYNNILANIIKQYTISKQECNDFVFTGFNLKQTADSIVLTQKQYLDKLDLDSISDLAKVKGDKTMELNEEQQDTFRKAIGMLQWISSNSMPELSYLSTHYAARSHLATPTDARKLFRTLSKAKNELTTIKFHNLGPAKNWKLVTFSDSSWVRSEDFESVNANVTAIMGQSGVANLLDWQSYKPQVPAASAMTAESEACLQAHGKLRIVKHMFSEILNISDPEAYLVTDSKSLQSAVNTTRVPKDKRMFVCVATLRAITDKENIKVVWCNSRQQIADQLTKPTADPSPLLDLAQKGILPDIF